MAQAETLGRVSRISLLTGKPLIAILLASFIARVALITSGVQNTFDDFRYARALDLLRTHDVSTLLTTYDHMGFTVASIVPAFLHRIAASLSGQPIDHFYFVPAFCFAFASLGCIALIYGIALRAGAPAKEALLAALLFAITNSFFYWVPYVLPYDLGLFLMLLALYVGLGESSSRPRSMMVGLITWTAFLVYNGHWILGAVVLAIHVFQNRQFVTRALFALVGFLAMPVLLIVGTRGDYIVGMSRFGSLDSHGLYGEGWSLPFEVFWHAEFLTVVIWLLGLAAALDAYLRTRDNRALVWFLALAGVYVALVAGSVVLEQFVVHGRHARQMIPFLVLLSAYGLAHLSRRPRRQVVAAAVLVALPSFIQPFTIGSPRDAELRAKEEVGDFARESTILGSWWKPDDRARYVLLNTEVIESAEGVRPPPNGRVIFSVKHPYRFEALLYEGATPEERAIIRAASLRMTLIDRGVASGRQ